MNLGILKTVIGTVAPSLGTALGGPMGGMAVNLVTKALGIDAKSSPKQLQAAVEKATPEQLAALKKVETEFEVRMKELDVDLFKLETADVQEARNAFKGDWTPKVFGLVALFGFVGYIFLVTIQPPSENSDTIVSLVLGYLGGLVSGISSFYFGASHSKGE
ncbi:hypothetical protein [uncultured Winogradskyella sp.]|jgi:hypothetical protein|uniref:hypothetical protein n=1 Tax=uncultured Winogradskyella sp. TaxID=395353 RepID=UPI0030D87278|tara:strand:+ start:1319 stop:1801 length:483 start_codon:yes stop_codon:yes gene_type:complete